MIAIGSDPDGTNINCGCGATDTALLQREVVAQGAALGIAFDGDGDRIIAVDEQGEIVDGDGIVAILALDLGVDLVAVTQMTNLGFHALMRERGIRVVTTDVGDRYVLEALEREDGVLGGEQSGHVIYLRDHVTGDGLAAGLLLCAALHGRAAERGGRRPAALRPVQGERPRDVEGADEARPGGDRARAMPSSAKRAACSSGRPAPSRSFGCSWRPATRVWRRRPVVPSLRLSRASSAEFACCERRRALCVRGATFEPI